jgi:ribonuclease R
MPKQRKKLSIKKLASKIEDYLTSNAGQSFSPRQLQKRLKVKNGKKDVLFAADKLLKKKTIVKHPDGSYQFQSSPSGSNKKAPQAGSQHIIEGIVDKTRNGAAFIVSEDRQQDVFIAPRRMGTALHGDHVRVRVFSPGKRRPEGEILEVTKRFRDQFVGRLVKFKNHAIVETEDGKTHFDIKVPIDETADIQAGTIVVVKVEHWAKRKGQAPHGTIATVLGKAGTNEIEMNSILIKNGFNLTFSEEVMAEAEALQEGIHPMEEQIREDFRQVNTLTIDPATAKDFDDALSYRKLENGFYEVGVHIADVTHYLREGSAMDEEAKERTTSVYLVDRVCPMLPEKLSNNLCSLRPHEDRYAFSAVFTFNSQHQIEKRWFGKTIIHSNHRFTYDDAQQVIDGASHELQEEVLALRDVARRLRDYRYDHGSISFETDEVQFELDEEGRPVEVFVKERKEAHLLVEDLMLLANKEVATFIIQKSKEKGEIPFVYRVHDVPDPDKISDFKAMAQEVGFNFDTSNPKAITSSFNKLVEQARRDEALKVLEPLAIRTMAKAVYDVDNIGHYGLGFDNYAHFTSPIRRYADVWVHRILQENLGDKTLKREKGTLKKHCAYISKVERRAMDAERESIKYKQTEFLKDKVGQTLPGYISGIIEKGIFVELEGSMAEGLVPFSSLNEPFSVETRKYRATGERSGWELKMGKRVRVKILGTDLTRREIDMKLVTLVEDEE